MEAITIINHDFQIITPENLRWFYIKYKKTLTTGLSLEGINKLYEIARSSKFDFNLQPKRIRKRILELLRSNSSGEKYANKLAFEYTTKNGNYNQEILYAK